MLGFKKYGGSLLLAGLLWISCAEPEIIIPPLEVPTSGKTVLLEELTGVRCPNCPSANARLEAIKSIYGSNIVIVSIHGELLTTPLPESRYDFRNPFAVWLENDFKPIIGKPSVVINRKIHPQFNLLANPVQDQWQTIVENELQLPQTLAITADIRTMDPGLEINIGMVPLQDLQENLKLHLFITENGIVDAQEDVDRIIPDYRHDHILRTVLTGNEGIDLGSVFMANQVINHRQLLEEETLDPDWNRARLELVIFVTHASGGVLQAHAQSLSG